MGTHQARPLPTAPHLPAPPTVAPSASYLSIPPSEPLPRARSSAGTIEAPSGSSGLVPVRGGVRPPSPLGHPGGAVPTIVPLSDPSASDGLLPRLRAALARLGRRGGTSAAPARSGRGAHSAPGP